MNGVYVISMDVHCQSTDIVVLTPSGRVRERRQIETTIPALRSVIETAPRPRHVVLEEGPLAGWLIRELSPDADKVVSCDPRRNALIAKDSDKDDPIDADKLGRLYRGDYIRSVHHPATRDRALMKQIVGLYHDRVRHRVQQANHLIAQLRRWGLMIRESAFADEPDRARLLESLPDLELLHRGLRVLWDGYDAAVRQEKEMRRELTTLAKREPQIRRFCELPGVKWIRATTIYAYLDTPFRFRGKSALWKYMGIGLERRHSGAGPVRLGVSRRVNRRLKNAIVGAAKSAIVAKDNPFAEQHERWLDAGLTPRIARRNVARSLATVMWGMWKSGGAYRSEWVGLNVTATAFDRGLNRIVRIA